MSQYTHHIPPPCEEEVSVLYADDEVLVVEKPAGLLTVPGRFVKDSVLQRVRFEHPDAVIVHRLDLDTSGLLVISKSINATRDLNRQFREREVVKAYTAVVFGEVRETSGEISLGIRPDPDNRPRQLIDNEAGKAALTRYEVLQVKDDASLLRLTPVTGRSHQLRIHLAAIGHPILGCDLYAHDDALAAAERLLLHASSLAFAHPETGEICEFDSPPPFQGPFKGAFKGAFSR